MKVFAAEGEDSRDVALKNIVFDWKHFPRAGLKVQMIRGRGAALRSVVDDEGVRERPCQFQECSKMSCDPLWSMIGVNNREVLAENRERIAIERELLVERD